MKKAILFFAMAVVPMSLTTVSCSSDRDDEVTAPAAQDFTNADFIKKTMVGTWDYYSYKYYSSDPWRSISNMPGTTQYSSYYKFNNDLTYVYKPYSAVSDNSSNENGTYEITPVKGEYSAFITVTYQYNNKTFTRKVILDDLQGNIVSTHYTSIISPSGTMYEQYKKQ